MPDAEVRTQRYPGLDAHAFQRLPAAVREAGLAWFEEVAPGRWTMSVERVDDATLLVRTLPRDDDALAARPLTDTGEIATDDVLVPAASCPPDLLAHL